MNRREFHRLAIGSIAFAPTWLAHAQQSNLRDGLSRSISWRQIEAESQGRLGVAILDTATGHFDGCRLDEPFAMCSTFKWLAAAYVLHRVDQGQEQLSRRIRYGREVLLPNSPLTQLHAEGDGMTLAELCEAAITVSDNAAGNLILDTFGGPTGLTSYVSRLGDKVTRLDRWETELNEAVPGDLRDTTTPRAMAQLLKQALVDNALSPTSRAQLLQWMEATRSNLKRLRANLPEGWRLGSKTGTGQRGSTNDVGVFLPPGRAPIVLTVYITDSNAELAVREGVIAKVARMVTSSLG